MVVNNFAEKVMKNIVVGIDISKMSNEVLKRAILISENKNAHLIVVHTIDSKWFEGFLSNKVDTMKITTTKKIEEEIEKLNLNNVKISLIITTGAPAEEIVEKAEEFEAELIIIGANAKDDLNNSLFGSTAHKIAQKSHLPLLIVKNACVKEYQNILAFSDLTATSEKSINFAKDFFENSKFKLICAYNQPSDFMLTFYNEIEQKDAIKEDIKKKMEDEFSEFKQKVVIDNGSLIESYYNFNDVLLEASKKEQNDLVVLGSHGVKTANTLIFGSTSSYLMEAVGSDILIYVPLKV